MWLKSITAPATVIDKIIIISQETCLKLDFDKFSGGRRIRI